MDGDDDLAAMLLGHRAQQRRELRNVHLVHALHGIIDDEPRER